MRIYQPVKGIGGALKENAFIVIDDVGVEIGSGWLQFRVLRNMFPSRPLVIEMAMDAHPVARDTLFGALTARASSIVAEHKSMPARLFTRCAIDDEDRHAYFTGMGFDDFDGDEFFVLPIDPNNGRRRYYNPVGTQSVDVDLRTRVRREEFLSKLVNYGYEEHASEWLEARMHEPGFFARELYYGSDFVGAILVTGRQNESVLEMVCAEKKWRGRGVASSLIEEATEALRAQNIAYLCANAVRRNASAMRMFKRCEFEWVRTDCYLLGRDI